MPKSKSAYSIPTKKQKPDTYIFVVWVDNEAGVLARVVGLFSGRGYNIESLAVAEVDAVKNISRITIVTTGTPQVIDQIKLQLKKLVPVHKVADFKREDKNVIFKEMALLKVVGNKSKIDKCLKACKTFNPVILDKTITFIEDSEFVDNVVENLKTKDIKYWLFNQFPEGESYSEVFIRAKHFISETLQKNNNQIQIVVSHGGFIGACLSIIDGLEINDFPHYKIRNCEIIMRSI